MEIGRMRDGRIPGEAVSVCCRSCETGFFVTAEPDSCPHCGSDEVAVEHGVRVEPI